MYLITKPDGFKPMLWEGFIARNCYHYALNYRGPRSDVYFPGEFSFCLTNRHFSKGFLTFDEFHDLLFADCFTLGIKIRDADVMDAVNPGEWKIAFFESKSHKNWDFHFLREDMHGQWSHKFTGMLPSKVDDNCHPITDPRYAYFEHSYQFISCFILSIQKRRV